MPLDVLVTGRIATFAGAAGYGWVEAVGIKDGRIAFAGSAVELETRADPHTRRFELEPGEIAVPGLTDAHLHLAEAALAADQIDLTSAATLPEGLAAIGAVVARLAPGAWLEGAGWDQRRWGRWPTAADLDSVVGEWPAALWSFDHHALWVSSAALRTAGIEGGTPDPPGGIIRRDAAGAPDGVVLENACPLVSRHIPPASAATLERAIEAMARELLAMGVVAVHDPGPVVPDPTLAVLASYGEMADRGDLELRVHACLRSENLALAIERGLRSGALLGADPEGRARLGWLKLFCDGTLGSQTAALLDPIEGGTERGVFRMPREVLTDLAERAAEGSITTQVHAIGDAAVRAALDALAPTVGRSALMPRLEHVQLCHPEDRPRFATLGIAASVQPVHLREDGATARRDWGPRAEAWGYTWRTLLESGAVLAFGTDAPVEPIDPWPGIAMAVLRRDPGWGSDAPPFGPAEALSLEEALRANCVAPAITAAEPDRGRLMPGSRADLIVLPPAPKEPDERAASFAAVRPRLVLMDGEAVIQR
jgi:predicted amidohydrolase YtcJ